MIVFESVFVILFGLVIGSFLNVCIYRIPEGKSIAFPPSHCPKCGTQLKALDLIPVLSYFFLKRSCRYCKDKISVRYAGVELLTALVYLALYLRFSWSIEFIAFAFIMSILIAVFFIDIDHKIIPDELVIAGIIGGAALIVYNIFAPFDIFKDRMWWNPVIGAFAASIFLFLVALLGSVIFKTDEAMGMGDIKLFVPIGIFLGWKICLVALMFSIVLGGLTSIILLVLRKTTRKATIPFGPFIVIGTFIAIMYGWNILNWYLGYL